MIRYMRDNQLARVQPGKTAEDNWVKQVAEVAGATLFAETDSWYGGSNVPGKERTFLIWAGGNPAYREILADTAARGYEGFEMK